MDLLTAGLAESWRLSSFKLEAKLATRINLLTVGWGGVGWGVPSCIVINEQLLHHIIESRTFPAALQRMSFEFINY